MMTLSHTQQAYILSLNIISTDDAGLHLVVVPLVSLSWLFMLCWRTAQQVSKYHFWLKNAQRRLWRVSEQTSACARAWSERLNIAGKLLGRYWPCPSSTFCRCG
jgi:hypothetical protein